MTLSKHILELIHAEGFDVLITSEHEDGSTIVTAWEGTDAGKMPEGADTWTVQAQSLLEAAVELAKVLGLEDEN